MKIKIREQNGTDAVRKFDYQMAVAIDYLLSEINNNTVVLIETLEDFAVIHDFGTEKEKVDIFQVKTKDKGLMEKSTLLEKKVYGKIALTDYYFDAQANSLNIICNTNLKGTEKLENFTLLNELTDKDIANIHKNILEYFLAEGINEANVELYKGKLVYIKSSLPFSDTHQRYEENLIGKTNAIIMEQLGEEIDYVNPHTVFTALKYLVDYKRRIRFSEKEIEWEKAISSKAVSPNEVKSIIDIAAKRRRLSKKEILKIACDKLFPIEYQKIKEEYPNYLAASDNLMDEVYKNTKKMIEQEYKEIVEQNSDWGEIIRKVSKKVFSKIDCYSLPIIQIITITVMYE